MAAHVPASRRGRRRGRLVALAAASLASAWPAKALDEVPLASIAGRVPSNVRLVWSERGLEVPVDGESALFLPIDGAEELEIDAVADGLMTLTWASGSHGRASFFGPPWRYRPLTGGAARLRLDLRWTAGWTFASHPILLLEGTGRLLVTRLRVGLVPADPEVALAAYDRALRWAPESAGHTTVNFLTAPMWSASRGTTWAEALAWVFGALLAAGIAGALSRRRPDWGRAAVAVASLVAVGLWDVGFLARFLPLARTSIRLDPEERIRDGYSFAPELGALVVLARATLGPGERVGVMGARNDWFSPQTLCFNLAPRRCAILGPGEGEWVGISGVGRLRPDEIDAVVAFHPGRPLPAGFAPSAGVTPRALIARRP